MTFWIVFQVVINIAMIALGLVVWARVSRPQKDDPRLSRGLQLLQSKIAVLEDLSDRTDIQVKQLSQLLDQKAKDMDMKISSAEEQLLKVDRSMQKSLEVSKIFQDKIPHKEIIERQNTLKYIQAARLAHQGMAPSEIAQKVDIPMGELEFIAKVNKSKLMFSEEHLPEWVQDNLDIFENQQAVAEPAIQPTLARSLNLSFENRTQSVMNTSDIERIEMEFKKAVENESQSQTIQTENTSNNSIQSNIEQGFISFKNTPETNFEENSVPPVNQSSNQTQLEQNLGQNVEVHLPETGELEIGLEADLSTSELRSNIQKAKELLNRTMDKALNVKENESVVSEPLPKVIKSEKSRGKSVKPYSFRKIEM